MTLVKPLARSLVKPLPRSLIEGVGFTPLSLSPTVWYDPSDLSTMFQDSAGTVPVTADGDPVGRINDKSGNANHWLQASSSLRPAYHTSGGLHWLETDGVDDLMSTGAVLATMGMPLTLLAAAAVPGGADNNQNCVVWMGTGSGAGGANNAFAHVGVRPSNLYPYAVVRGSGLTPSISTIPVIGSTPVTTPTVIAGLFSSGSQIVRTNGVDLASSSNDWTSQAVTGAALVMGGGSGTAPAGVRTALVQKYYGVVAIFDALSSDTLRLLEAWLASKAGVTL